MPSIDLDKFTEQMVRLRDQANKSGGPGAATRIQVYMPTAPGLTADTTYPDLANLTGPHFHRPNEVSSQHGAGGGGQNWPECVIIQ